jgi:IS5 family transposase
VVTALAKDDRPRLYCKLIAATDATRAARQWAADRLTGLAGRAAGHWRAQVRHYLPLIARVLEQGARRVLHGQAVPASEKLVCLFEPHADIIVKGGRDVQYGHKLNLVTGRSGLILDLVIETGNPADAERFLPMLDRYIARCDTRPARWPLMAVMPAATISIRPKRVASVMSPSTRSAALPSPIWPERLDLSHAAQLPRRHRGWHLLLQARRWRGTLDVARARPLQGVCLVCGGGPQPGVVRPPQTGIKATPLPHIANGDHLNPARVPVHVNRAPSRELLARISQTG